MSPEQALALILGISSVAMMSGSIVAILLKIPGEGENVLTILDGYPMTQRGEAGRALGAAITASGMGGIASVAFALIMVPIILPVVFTINSADMVFIILMGLSFIAVLSRGSMTKGLISGCVGIILSFVGLHVMTGVSRFDFGTVYLRGGIPVIPALMGLFAMPEMVQLAVSGGTIAKLNRVILSMRGVIEGVKDFFHHWTLWLRSALIGYVIGIIPGIGGMTSIVLAYAQAKQTSKYPEKFGTGVVEGVIAPESANKATLPGALLTTLSLGIPGSSGMVLYLAALMMLGIRPGPEMMTEHLPLTFSVLQVVFLGGVLGAIFCLLVAPRLARIATIPVRILVPIVVVVVFIGCFASEQRLTDLITMLVFGVVGLAMEKYGFNNVGRRVRYYTDNNEDAIIMTTPELDTGAFRSRFDDLRRRHRAEYEDLWSE